MPCAVVELVDRLKDVEENPMVVSHVCAEALGGIAAPGVDVEFELAKYLSFDIQDVVCESCVIALYMADYNNSTEFLKNDCGWIWSCCICNIGFVHNKKISICY